MSTAKIQVIANARELLWTYLSIKNDLNSAEVRDPQTKKTYSILPCLKMCNHHIPTKAEMNGKGLLKKLWKVYHFFGTAEYYSENAGFQKGKLPCHEEWCEDNQDAYTVYVSVFGDIIRINDPNIQQWYEQIVATVAFPPKLYNRLCKNVLLNHLALMKKNLLGH
jgi:hypothetical protein